jgi:hypothetical protein
VVAEEFDLAVPNLLSRQCFATEELLASVSAALRSTQRAGRQLDSSQDALLRRLVVSLEGRLSCDRILDALEEHKARLAPSTGANWRSWWQAYARLRRRDLSRAVRTRLKWHASSKIYTAHKFPDIDTAEVNARIARFQDTLGRFHGLRARQMSRNIFAIERG